MTIERALELLPQMRDSKWIDLVGHVTDIYTDEAKEAFNMAISALEKQEEDRWVSVTERLPEYGTEVLTQLSDNDIVTNWVIDEEDEEWFEDDVIAWRPLPELFQEEE